MLKRLYVIILTVAVAIAATGCSDNKKEASPEVAEMEQKDENLDVKEIIFEHLGDGYGWEVPFSHTHRVPLPVIVRAQDHKWFMFSSAGLTRQLEYTDSLTGKTIHEMVPVVKTIERDGKTYRFVLAHISKNKDKVVEISDLSPEDQKEVDKALAATKEPGAVDNGEPVIDGYVYVENYAEEDGKISHTGEYFKEYRPLDLSITKNVMALIISVIVVIAMVFSLMEYYKRRGLRAPRKGMGFIEMIVEFIYYDTIKPTLGDNTRKFAPYLLTVFFFILTMNLLGLIVVFPGGANLTGNLAVTIVLAVCTFVLTNVLGTKHYWKEIFWPDVPIWLKCPIPIMQFIEIFGIFTKPAALAVRLFANMMGGHIIVITLTLLIFIFAAFGAAVAGAATVVSILFSIFMLALDVLVSFIQAYVFTLLSTLFIALAQEKEEEHKIDEDARYPSEEEKLKKDVDKQKALLHNEALAMDDVARK